MNSANYFLPADYQGNLDRITFDESEGEYWDQDRLAISMKYQFGVYAFASRLIKRRRCKTVFDIGCGPGGKLSWLHRQHPKVQFTGFDQPNAIAFCQKQYDWGHWISDDFDHPRPIEDGEQADLVVCSDVIEHVSEPDRLLDYIGKRIARGGVALLSTPDRARLYDEESLRPSNRYHMREWAADEFESYLADRGYRVLKIFHQLPVRIQLGRVFYSQVVQRFIRGQSTKYNLVCLVEKI